MSIQFYNDELACMTNGKVKYDTIDFDPKKYKTCAGAAKALFKACLLYTSPSPRD